jgi:hypothetical protein
MRLPCFGREFSARRKPGRQVKPRWSAVVHAAILELLLCRS